MFSISAVIIFIVVLGVLVLLHECGHALVAWWAGVTVEEFGIGFPPRLLSHKRKGTLYTINLIPLGGFVKLKGIAEQGSSEMTSDTSADFGNFQQKPIALRLCIVGAGIVMNALVAVVLFTLTLGIGFHQPAGNVGEHAITTNPQVQIISVVADSPAQKAGIQPGDAIYAVNGAPIRTTEQMQQTATQYLNVPVHMAIERNGEQIFLNVTPEEMTYDEMKIIGIGVGLQDIVHARYPWYRAPLLALQMTIEMTIAIFSALGSAISELFLDHSVPDGLTGPVGIAIITGQVAESGIIALLQFAAILSINLALFNVLPIPALDGGRLFFLLFELVTRKKVNQKVEMAVHQLGFVLLITLMILVTVQDIIHLR